MALIASDVTRQFLRKRGNSNVFNAVENVSLTLENNRLSVITGPSGSGKSTLLNMMAGILTPTKGTITVDGTDLYSMDDEKLSAFRNTHIGVIPQGQTPISSLNVMDNVLLPYVFYTKEKHKGQSAGAVRKTASVSSTGGRKEAGERRTTTAAESKTEIEGYSLQDNSEEGIRKRAEALLGKTGIRDLAESMPSELSGGELRRMAIARAMLLRPDVILADEPTADLDEENTQIVLSMMRYAAQEGSAVMIVTHDKDVFSWADKVYTLRAGHLEDGE